MDWDEVRLAEPRRKAKWGMNPRGNHWMNDDQKFGQKMLEKMGWTKGKGLGLKENGITSQVEPERNSGTQGLGYKDKDNYANLASDYEKVLAQLNAKHGSSNSPTASSSSVSSEEESDHKTRKPLKIRHRYGRIRKKDVSTYSEEDWAKVFAVKVHEWKGGIFTKKEDKDDAKDVQPSVKQEDFDSKLYVKEPGPASSDCSKTIVKKRKKIKEEKVEELETNLSVDNKMQIKQEDVFESPEGYEPPVTREDRKKKKRRKHEDTEISPSTEKQDKFSISVQVEDSESLDTANGKKKKKRKKGKGSH